jgi:hypothetical protein
MPLLSAGLTSLAPLWERRPAWRLAAPLIAFFVLGLIPAYLTLPRVSLRGITVARDWVDSFVTDLEPDSLIYAGTINRWDALTYGLEVMHPEVDAELSFIAEQQALVEENFGKRPIYAAGNDYWLSSTFVLDPPPPPPIASLLRQVPAGYIVILATYDDASLTLDEATIQAFRRAGIASDLRQQYRVAHLAVGVQGAAAGTAYEQVGTGLLYGRIRAGQAIGFTGVPTPVDIQVRAASLRRGIGGQIYVNGHNVAPGVRGYNVVIINPENGLVESVFSRDLTAGLDVDGLGRFRIIGRWHGDEIEVASPELVAAWNPPAGGVIDFAGWSSNRFMGRGWGLTEDWGVWTEGERAILYVHLEPQAYQLTVEAMPFAAEDRQQTIELFWNSQTVGEVAFTGVEPQQLQFAIPAEVVTGELDQLTFQFGYAISPFEVTQGQSADQRFLAVWFINMQFVPKR